MSRLLPLVLLLGVLATSLADASPGSRILATGGASPIEGGSGGGLSPWATITGYASSGETGYTAFATHVSVADFALTTTGAAVGWNDRLEASFTRQRLQVDALDTALEQHVYGVKVRLFGRLLYTPWPQVSAGAQHKRHRDFALPAALGARDDSGTDMYLSASKLWFAGVAGRNVFANVTARRTRAAETGLLGFGGEHNGYRMVMETSVALFLTDRWAVGYEYRQKPDPLASVRERDWQDAFVAFFPSKRVSFVAARVDLDEIANLPGQDGWYLSVQVAL